MDCIALVRCGNCTRKTGLAFEAPSINGRVPHRLLVEEAARRCDAFTCSDCEARSPYLISLGQIEPDISNYPAEIAA